MNAESIREVLQKALEDSNPEVQKAAADAVDRVERRRDVENLLGRFESTDTPERVQAVYGLGRMQDPRAREALARALQDELVDVRASAARVLAECPDPDFLEVLTERIDDPESVVRRAAIVALGCIGDRRATIFLEALLDDAEPSVLREVLDALGRTGGSSPDRIAPLLEHKDAGVRAAAVSVLAGLLIAELNQA